MQRHHYKLERFFLLLSDTSGAWKSGKDVASSVWKSAGLFSTPFRVVLAMMMSRNMCSRLGCVLTYTWHFPRPRLSDAIPPSTDVCENKITGGEEKCETVHMVIWHGAVGNMGEMWGNWSMNIVRLQLT